VSEGDGNTCVLESAELVGGEEVVIRDKGALEKYLSQSYFSTGLGVRFIIPNLASVNLDWGVPIFEPANKQSQCLSFAESNKPGAKAPKCVKRRADDNIAGVISFPGAFFLGIGASF
jgi:hypothetical protein